MEEQITCGELIEKLKNFPKDYTVKINRKYFSDGDYDYGWHSETLTDICDIDKNDEEKTISIQVYS